MNGFFGKMFDLNRDEKLDTMERAMDYMLFNKMMQEDEEECEENSEEG